jgi:hypothetical protein
VPDRPLVPQRAHDAVARQHDDHEPAVPQQHQLRLVPRPGTRAATVSLFLFKGKKMKLIPIHYCSLIFLLDKKIA